MRTSLVKDRAQFYKDLAIQVYGANRPGAKVSQVTLDQFWFWSMQAGLLNAYESIKAFSETDFTDDLKKFELREEIGETNQRRSGNLLSVCAARPYCRTSGSGQRRFAWLHPQRLRAEEARVKYEDKE